MLKFMSVWAGAMLLLGQFAWGAETGEWIRHRQTLTGIEFAILHPEEAHWVLGTYFKPANDLQDLVSERSFDSGQEARRAFDQLTENWSEGRPTEAALGTASLRFATARKPIWDAKNDWSWEWEKKYADWVEHEFTPDYLRKYNVKTDCADLAFTTRWIFSRIHKLPAANRLAGTESLFTHETVRPSWADLPTAEEWYNDKLFRAALEYLLNNTYTHTLFDDSYPIAINLEALIPGTHHLHLSGQNGHTLVVHHSSNGEQKENPLEVIMSTDPREIRDFPSVSYFDMSQPTPETGGFMKMLWPIRFNGEWKLLPAEKMPFYSKDQYGREIIGDKKSWIEALLARIAPKYDTHDIFKGQIEVVRQRLEQRRQIVEQGSAFCASNDCSPGTQNYENFSTPSRDGAIGEALKQLNSLHSSLAMLHPEFQNEWEKLGGSTFLHFGGTDYTLFHLMFTWDHSLFNSDPRVSTDERWGLSAEAFVQAIRDRIQAALDDRAKKITEQGNRCDGHSCAFGSDAWKKWNTFEADNKTRKLGYLVTKYCETAPKTECARIEEQLAIARLSAPGFDGTLGDALSWLPWLNSDPRTSTQARWGAQRDQKKRWFFRDARSIQVHKSGWALIESGGSSYRLENLPSGERKALGVLKDAAMDKDSGTLATLALEGEKTILRVLRLSGEKAIEREVPSDTTVGWEMPGFLRWSGTLSTGVIRLEGEALREYGPYVPINPFYSKGTVGIISPDGNEMILDFRQAEIKQYALSRPQANRTHGVSLAFDNDEVFIGSDVIPENTVPNSPSFILSKKSGITAYTRFEGTPVAYFPETRSLLVTVSQTQSVSSYLAKVDQNWNIIEKTKSFHGAAFVIGKYIALASYESLELSYDLYEMEHGEMKRVPLLADEVATLNLSQDAKWLTTRTRSGLARFRSLETDARSPEAVIAFPADFAGSTYALLGYKDTQEFWNEWYGFVPLGAADALPVLTGEISIIGNYYPESIFFGGRADRSLVGRGVLVRTGPKQMIWWEE